MLVSWKQQAKWLKQQSLVVYFAARDPRTPVHVRALGLLIAAYALSPLDLIPDFIPLLGYLDDLLLIPLGLALVIKLTPSAVIESARSKANQAAGKPVSYPAAAFIITIWLLVLWFVTRWVMNILRT